MADACEVLGVGADASAEEIRAAWKRAAFDTHPDRHGGTSADFDRARAAYHMLKHIGTAPDPQAMPMAPVVRRPSLERRRTSLSPAVVEACRQALQERPVFPGSACRLAVLDLDTGKRHWFPTGRPATDHVPVAMEREGRNLRFFVVGHISEGGNRVALPGAEFQDRKKILPRIVLFTAGAPDHGDVAVPAHLVADVVPGASRVIISFVTACWMIPQGHCTG